MTAGKGNAELLARLGRQNPAMQLRPLLMVMVRGQAGYPLPGELFAHCLGASANPRITITSHTDSRGNVVWYLGGDIAEQGVGRGDAEQIAAARRELESLFPWQDFSRCDWGILPIDRAEPRQPDGKRPDNVFCAEEDGVITAWPTKLALAPRLADEIIKQLKVSGVEPAGASVVSLPPVEFTPLPWQEDERWINA